MPVGLLLLGHGKKAIRRARYDQIVFGEFFRVRDRAGTQLSPMFHVLHLVVTPALLWMPCAGHRSLEFAVCTRQRSASIG
jgi:hypothetical protein